MSAMSDEQSQQQQPQPQRPQRQQSNDDAPPSYEEALGMETFVLPIDALGTRAPASPSDDSSPPPYYMVVGGAPPRPDNFRMDMSEFPATSHPPIEAYYEDGWKWTVGVFIVSILGIILLAVLVSVLMTLKNTGS
ncbi:protein UL42 [Mandrillus leucophaeus cytomegalovirus]|uniref:Protein UL42 n=1 Tax=Mandrillus leucophaeus cytomegalovirus TaxID=1654930 RepID=A0A0G2UM21_9BETA|nr:protein UL42 [Mandrillus leucophaeus cytomegalovirus]AKI29787.1 protein UL42 [Mandrillus leucophaeus cytomegalovirus]